MTREDTVTEYMQPDATQPPLATGSRQCSPDIGLDILPQVLITLPAGFTGACTLIDRITKQHMGIMIHFLKYLQQFLNTPNLDRK